MRAVLLVACVAALPEPSWGDGAMSDQEFPSERPGGLVAIFLTNDSGTESDAALARTLAAHGMPGAQMVLPERAETTAAAARIDLAIRHYREAWRARGAVLVARDTVASRLPEVVRQLPAESRAAVVLVTLIEPRRDAGDPDALRQLGTAGVQCLGAAATTMCGVPPLSEAEVGGYDSNDPDGAAKRILAGAKRRFGRQPVSRVRR